MLTLHYEPLNMPCEFDFTISRGTQSVAEHVLVRLVWTDANNKTWEGLGEAVPAAYYGETQASVIQFLHWIQNERFLEAVTPYDLQALNETMQSISGQMAGKAAIEMALWDILGKLANLPVHKLWGLNPTQIPKSSYTIGLASLPEVEHKTRVALERGYDILKVKVGGPQDIELLQTIRRLAPAPITIRVDANAAWTPNDAIALFPTLQQFNVEFIEEPLQRDASPTDRARVKQASPLPLIADESCHTLSDVPVVAQWFDGVNLKLPKTGGLWEATRMIHTARAHNLSIMLGCFAESSLSITAFAQLAPLVDYLDLDGGLLLANDPMLGITWQGSQLTLPNGPGLGVQRKISTPVTSPQ